MHIPCRQVAHRTHPPARPLARPPLPTTLSPSPIPCGNSTVYCPAGSSTPSAVSAGNYSFGGTSAAARTAEELCPKGRYCQKGLAVLCPAGTFGDREGLQDPACSGPCPAGKHDTFDATRTAFGGVIASFGQTRCCRERREMKSHITQVVVLCLSPHFMHGHPKEAFFAQLL